MRTIPLKHLKVLLMVKQTTVLGALFMTLASCGKKEDSKVAVSFDFGRASAIDAKGTSCSARADYNLAKANCVLSGSCTTNPTMTTGDVGFPYASLGNLTINWTGEGTFSLIYLRFKFSSNLLTGGTYVYTYGDKELWTGWRSQKLAVDTTSSTSAQKIFYDPPTNPSIGTATVTVNGVQSTQVVDTRDVLASRTTNTNVSDCDVYIPSLPIAQNKRNQAGLITGQAFLYGVQTKADNTEVPVTAFSPTITIEWIALDN